MKTMYEKPEIEVIAFKAMEALMVQDGDPSITDGDEDWGDEDSD